MLFHGLNNSIELDVVGYQFPDSPKSGKDNFDYDSNWLVLSICYTDRDISAKQRMRVYYHMNCKTYTKSYVH